MSLVDRRKPSAEEYAGFKERFKNWGRWGKDDEFGTLNFITDETRRKAAGLIVLGRTISCADPVATMPGPRNPNPAQHYMKITSRGSTDYVGSYYHGVANTHLDALCHVFADEQHLYNGQPTSEVTTDGARVGSIENWRHGIVTRGVLYDIPRLRGTDYVDPSAPVQGWELEDAAKAEGIVPTAGDAVLVRTGKVPFLRANPNTGTAHTPGVDASVLEFLHAYDAALFGADMTEVRAEGYPPLQIHSITIPFMGLPLLDNANLQELSEVCAQQGRWEFQFVIAPLVVIGGTGSLVNPLAMF
jgi:kynurenine formamidase